MRRRRVGAYPRVGNSEIIAILTIKNPYSIWPSANGNSIFVRKYSCVHITCAMHGNPGVFSHLYRYVALLDIFNKYDTLSFGRMLLIKGINWVLFDFIISNEFVARYTDVADWSTKFIQNLHGVYSTIFCDIVRYIAPFNISPNGEAKPREPTSCAHYIRL